MFKQSCILCKVVGILVIIGALNWGWIGLTGENLIGQIFGHSSTITKVLYILVGAAGAVLIVSFFTVCPKCKK
ncbi:MAG TPA: DUF378 domain-containing protein [Candidatus Omnitrophota bacterium]|nr:DUF378 domain-containing protein [Candidatus Omnitrophota bacterium]